MNYLTTVILSSEPNSTEFPINVKLSLITHEFPQDFNTDIIPYSNNYLESYQIKIGFTH